MSDMLQEISIQFARNITQLKDEQIKLAFKNRTGNDFRLEDASKYKFELTITHGASGQNRELYIMDGKPLIEIHDCPIKDYGSRVERSIKVRHFD